MNRLEFQCHIDSCRCDGRVAAPYRGLSVHVCHDPRHCVSSILKRLLHTTDASPAQPCSPRAAMLTKRFMRKPRVRPLHSAGCWRLKAEGTCQHTMWPRLFISRRSSGNGTIRGQVVFDTAEIPPEVERSAKTARILPDRDT